MTELLHLFDEKVRRGATAPGPAYELRWVGSVLRLKGPTAAAFDNAVLASRLTAADADQAIADAVAYFKGLGHGFEWKLFGYDEPRDLPARLAAAGLVAEGTETVMALDLAGPLPARTAAGIVVRRLLDPDRLADFQAVSDEVYGEDHSAFTAAVAAEMRAAPQTLAVYVAYDGEKPVSASRLVAEPGAEFASLWGGATLPAYRGRGIYRALVGERAWEAKRRGARYLTIDARSTSRPIVARLGFQPLTTTTPYIWTPT
jgi:ribosomal protein S18 acetylase RimI-like enzyme